MFKGKICAIFLALFALTCTAAQASVAAPTNIHVTTTTQTTISLAWSGTAPKYAVWIDGVNKGRVTTKSYTFTGLLCGTTHQVGVRAVNKFNQTSKIVYVSGSTLACTTGDSSPPPAAGYFTSLAPVGSFSNLPTDAQCAAAVHQSTWEPRPDNYVPNHTMPDPAAVSASFAARHYDSGWTNWNTLLQRVDGQFTGTTDEIMQWAACKWGIPDNVLRGIAVRESTWFQREIYANGRCTPDWSCGDFFTSASPASQVFCDGIDQFGYNYQADYGQGLCPKTFSITGIMSWDDPAWEAPNPAFPGNQNGTFPFSRNSTAFAEDFVAAHLRGCYNGWITWLGPSGDLWGCVGSWYSGDWHSAAADGYISRVQNEINNLTWLQSTWPSEHPDCSPTYGCPVGYTNP